jgi:hypothetical protein
MWCMTLLTMAPRWNGKPGRRVCLRPHAATLARHSQGVLRHSRLHRCRSGMCISCVEQPLQAVVVGASKMDFVNQIAVLNRVLHTHTHTRVALLAVLGCYAGLFFSWWFLLLSSFFTIESSLDDRFCLFVVVVVVVASRFRLFRASTAERSTWILKPSIKRTPSLGWGLPLRLPLSKFLWVSSADV